MIVYYLHKIKKFFVNHLKFFVITSILIIAFLIMNIVITNSILMAHALGSVEVSGKRYTYTNCKEAFYDSLNRGIKKFEVDLMLTKDNKVVAFHEYSKGIYNRLKVSDSNFHMMNFIKE